MAKHHRLCKRLGCPGGQNCGRLPENYEAPRVTHHRLCKNLSCPGEPNCGRLPQYYVKPVPAKSWDDGLRGPEALVLAVGEVEALLKQLDEIGRGVHLNRRERLALRLVLDAAKKRA